MVALAVAIFSLGIFRDFLYERALRDQPSHPLLETSLSNYIAYALIAAGNILVISSMWALGVTGTYLGDYFGILMDDIRIFTNSLNMEDYVKFTGIQRDVRPFYWSADLFTLCSDSETFSIAAMEAMACGLPAVLTDVGGLRDAASGYDGIVWTPAAQPEANQERDIDVQIAAKHMATAAGQLFEQRRGNNQRPV